MKKLLILSILVLSLFSDISAYAAAVLVEGDMESLVPLAGTPYLEGHPAIFFSDQQKGNIVKLLDKVEHLVITGDLSFLALDALAPSRTITLSEKAVQWVNKEDGYYEIWVPQSVVIPPELTIKINGTIIPLTDVRNKRLRRWYQISNAFHLYKGKHKIELGNITSFSGVVVLIPIKEKERLVSLYGEKIKANKIEIGYLFSGTKEHPLENINFESLGSGKYFLSGLGHFKPTPVQEKKIVKEIIFNTKDWLYTPERSEITRLQENGKEVVLKTLFDGPGNEDEFVRIHSKQQDGLKIDLADYPLIDLNYRIENKDVQNIEMVLKFGFEGEGNKKETGTIYGLFTSPGSTNYDRFTINALDTAQAKFPGKSKYTLLEIEIFSKKNYGVDMTQRSQKEFNFYIGDICFYKEEMVDKLIQKTYFFREDIKTLNKNSWSILEGQIPSIIAKENYVGFNVKPRNMVKLGRTMKPIPVTGDQKLFLEFQFDRKRIKEASLNLKFVESLKKKEFVFEKALNQENDGFQTQSLIFKDILENSPQLREGQWKLTHIDFLLALTNTDQSDKENPPFRLKELSLYQESEVKPEKALPESPLGYLEGRPLNIRRDLKLTEWDRQYPFLGEWVQLAPKIYNLNWSKQEKVIIDSVALYPPQLSMEKKESQPEIDFKKINPTRYLVTVKKAQKPFWLVFSESFHEGWKGYIRLRAKGEGQRVINQGQVDEPWSALWSAWKDRGRRVEIKEHFLVNGYANSWYIIPSSAEADQFDIILEFKPQRLFETGIIISGLTLLACIGYLLASYIRRRSKKQNHEA